MNKCSICPNNDLCNQVGGETMCLLMSNFKNKKVMKAIGVKMVDLEPMDSITAMYKNYKVGLENTKEKIEGYEVTYPDGYKSWCPKEIADKAYFKLNNGNNGDIIFKQNVKDFIAEHTVATVGSKTTLVHATTITGFELIDYSACVSPKNYSQELGEEYAMENIINKLWGYLGFVLQWAKNGITFNKENKKYSDCIQDMINEYHEINERTFKLGVFIQDNPKFKELDIEEQNDMNEQYEYMIKYCNRLGNRLKRLNIDLTK